MRNLVFISHANPEDNEFASWLGTRLTAAGYEVWADVFRLIGGETFWRDIGDAIKEQAAIVIVVVSRASYQKEGVLNEIAIAVAAGKKLGNAAFVLPIRLDDLPFDDFPEQIVRRNAIEFAKNWADGFSAVLEALQKAGVPKRDSELSASLEGWRKFRLRQAASVVEASEPVLSNWFAIQSLPSHLNFHAFNATQEAIKTAFDAFKTPTVSYLRLVGTFATPPTLQMEVPPHIGIKSEYSVPLEEVLEGQKTGGPGISRREGRNMVTNLLRQGWERFAEQRGLLRYEFSHGSAWFVPHDPINGNNARFVDQNGKIRRRRIVGRSEKRNVYWHLAVSAKPVLAEPTRLLLRPHVVFTTDGKTPIDSKTKAARLRKSFCKMWWNDRWRDLVRAFASFLANEGEAFQLPLGDDVFATVAAKPMIFSAALSIPGDGFEPVEDENVVEEETAADELDDLEDAALEEEELSEGEDEDEAA